MPPPNLGPTRTQRSAGLLSHDPRAWAQTVGSLASFNVAQASLEAIYVGCRAAGGKVAEQLEVALTYDSPGVRLDINRRVAEMARDSVLRSYDQRVTANQSAASRNNQAYRTRPGRLGGGRLRSALQHQDMYRATANGIDFVNTAVLNREAAHWRRLNYGVGARAGGRPGRFGMLSPEGRVIAQLGLTGGPSRRPMFLPEGFFLGPGGERVGADMARRGMDPFFASRAVRGRARGSGHPGTRVGSGRMPGRRPTRGIEARHYLDAGVRRIATEFPRLHMAYVQGLFQRASARTRDDVVQVPGRVRARARVITVTPRVSFASPTSTRGRRLGG